MTRYLFILLLSISSNALFGMENIKNHTWENCKDFLLATKKNDPSAQFNLGLMYLEGRGPAQNSLRALKWLMLAASQNYMRAQLHIGYMYFYGCGIAENYEEAMKWFLLAAKKNSPTAQFYIGFMYYKNHGVARDYEEAIKWLLKAFQNQNPKHKNKIKNVINYVFEKSKLQNSTFFEN